MAAQIKGPNGVQRLAMNG